jgi:TRAP-type C4-dicarboxylate transport system permease small subunit
MVLLSIVSRQLHFHLPGTDAYAGYLMAAAGFLALAHTLKKGEHIRVTCCCRRCRAAPRRALEIWALAAATLLAAAVGLVQRAGCRGSPHLSTTSPPATTPRRCGSRSWHGRRQR